MLCCAMQAAAARQPGRAYAKLVPAGLLADNITEQLAALGINDISTGTWVSHYAVDVQLFTNATHRQCFLRFHLSRLELVKMFRTEGGQ